MADTQATQSTEGQAKTFTQEEVNAIVGERLSRQSEKYADYEDLKTKAAEYDKQQEANKTELQKAQDKASKLQAELDSMKKKAAIDEIRSKVSKDTGVPVNLLTGEDEDSCKAQASAILKYAKGSKYPGVKEESHTSGRQEAGSATDNEFKQFAHTVFGRKD